MLTVGSLFAGIGGLELGLERAGLGPVLWQVERDPFCQRVLAKHWPNARRFDDVRSVGARELDRVDVICGGFPCQDISFAGKGRGLAGERSGLWFEFARIVRDVGPRFVVVENVAALLVRGMADVLGTLASIGYGATWFRLSARDVGAPHIRERVFIIADADGDPKPEPNVREKEGRGVEAPRRRHVDRLADTSGSYWEAEPGMDRVVDGFPDRLDRLRALGNAVVPQCAEVVGRVLLSIAQGETP